ncbi:MAG: class I SAM-dependent methyltransferase [Desulfobulbus sp.]|jgi:tRNA (guanine37-N1)-methyltransferase
MRLRQRLHTRFPLLDPALLPGGFDRVGDIALLTLADAVTGHAHSLAEAILEDCPFLRVVAQREGRHHGEFRIPRLHLLAGEKRLTTVHRENGITLHLDIARVYFSVRLAHERARIATQVLPGESVAVLGSGIGPFPLIIGKYSAARQVVGIEKNPAAHDYALRNLAANRIPCPVRLLPGDVATMLPTLRERFDRILVAVPYGGDRLLAHALDALRPGGMLHLYAMREEGRTDPVHEAMTLAGKAGYLLQPLRVVRCGHCGVALDRICLDARVGPFSDASFSPACTA